MSKVPLGRRSRYTAGAAAQTAKLLGGDAKAVFDAINVGLTFFPFAPGVNAKVGAQVKPLACNGWQVFAGANRTDCAAT